MQLFVMRHGQASVQAISDQARELTSTGEQEVALMARWLKKEVPNLTTIIASPYIRAQQTAQIVQKEFPGLMVETIDSITPSGKPLMVHDYLDSLLLTNKEQSIIFISHMPFVSYFVAELTYDQKSPIFQTAAIAHIDYDDARMKGKLLSLISPSEFR